MCLSGGCRKASLLSAGIHLTLLLPMATRTGSAGAHLGHVWGHLGRDNGGIPTVGADNKQEFRWQEPWGCSSQPQCQAESHWPWYRAPLSSLGVPECAVLPWVAQTGAGGERRHFHEAGSLKSGVCFCCHICRHYLPCRKNTNFQMSSLMWHK